jgi:hypothetical protein
VTGKPDYFSLHAQYHTSLMNNKFINFRSTARSGPTSPGYCGEKHILIPTPLISLELFRPS